MTKTKIITAIIGTVIIISAIQARGQKTTVTGDEMKILEGGDRIVYSGNSKVVSGDDVFTADKIVQNKKGDKIEAFGNIDFVTYTEEKEKVIGKAENVEYDIKKGSGRLWNGRPHIFYFVKTSSVPFQIEANSISFNRKKKEIFARGDVVTISSSTKAYAPEALFTQSDRRMVMAGKNPQPRVIFSEGEKTGDYKADKITVYMDKKKVFLENNVSGKITMPD